jgi:hypothetical protein
MVRILCLGMYGGEGGGVRSQIKEGMSENNRGQKLGMLEPGKLDLVTKRAHFGEQGVFRPTAPWRSDTGATAYYPRQLYL